MDNKTTVGGRCIFASSAEAKRRKWKLWWAGGGRAQCSVWESWSSDNRVGSVTPSPESHRKSSSVHSAQFLQQRWRHGGTRALEIAELYSEAFFAVLGEVITLFGLSSLVSCKLGHSVKKTQKNEASQLPDAGNQAWKTLVKL